MIYASLKHGYSPFERWRARVIALLEASCRLLMARRGYLAGLYCDHLTPEEAVASCVLDNLVV